MLEGILFREAHPRVRGDHFSERWIYRNGCGPPPRPRGSPHPIQIQSPYDGPTPASAGITYSAADSYDPAMAHPRVRGDHGMIIE